MEAASSSEIVAAMYPCTRRHIADNESQYLYENLTCCVDNMFFVHCGRFYLSHAELNPICHFLVLLRAHRILHVSRIRVNPYPANVENTVSS